MKHLKYYENIQSNDDIEIIKENLYDLQDILGEYSITKGDFIGLTPSNTEYSIKWVDVEIQFPNSGKILDIDINKLSNTIDILKELKEFGNKIKSQLDMNTYYNLTNNSFFISLYKNKRTNYQNFNPLTGEVEPI